MKNLPRAGTEPDIYFRVSDDRKEYRGERFFRFNYASERVIQICKSTGDLHRSGRSNMVGIYMIHKNTFWQNYLGMNYLVPITKEEYEEEFKLAIKILM